MGTKLCTKCGTEKSIEDFSRRRARPSGRMSQCKECVLAYKRERYRTNEGARKSNLLRQRYSRIENPCVSLDEFRELYATQKICAVCEGDLWKKKEVIPRENPDGSKKLYCSFCVSRPEGKFCSKCEMTKPLKDFFKKKNHAGELGPWCKTCKKTFANDWRHHPDVKPRRLKRERWYRIKMKYGLTKEEYLEIEIGQDGKCKICRVSFEEIKPCVDHDHETGEIRGLLCNNCNTALGLAKESISTLGSMIEYLQ